MMAGENQEIKIIGVGKEEIKISSDKKECWVVPFKLSLAPENSWQTKFYEVHQKDDSEEKRNARIVNGSLHVEVAVGDELQAVLNALKIQVDKINVLCEEDYQQKLKVRQELEALQKKQNDTTLRFKEDSDKLMF